MIWIIGAIALGLILGVIGYYFSKAAYSLFITTMGLFGAFSFSLVDNVAVESTGQLSEFRLLDLLFKAVDNMGYLPQHIQLAIVVFIATFFIARIITWFLTKMNVNPKEVESTSDRKQRILEQYGYKDGLPY